MLNTGIIVNNRYRIVKMLGQGGFGAVYRAWDTNLNQACALKQNLDTSLEAQRQFRREASTLAALSHPNLTRVTDYFFVAGQGQFLVMDYVDGEDLATIVEREGRFSPEQALPIITQVADALTYLHRQNPPIIHRDIKPANIRLTADGQVFLVDFGLVKVYDQRLRTTIGARAVTPGYSPPEQYGQGNTDARTDVYALAATLYTMLTGEEPQESVQRIVDDQLQPSTRVNTAVPETISAVLLQAMSLNPSQRYPSVEAFVSSLQRPQAPPDASSAALSASATTSQTGMSRSAAAAPATSGTNGGVKPVWWAGGTAVLLSAIFFLIILPNSRQQAAQELAWQITRQVRNTAVAQATTTARAEATGTAVAIVQATNTAYAKATATRQAVQTATAVSARATSSARSMATRQAISARATATVSARNRTVAALEAQATRTFGPRSGALTHEEDGYIEVYDADVSLKNFIVEATFVNPYSPPTGSWDYGFLFRHNGRNNQFRLSLHSNREWILTSNFDDSNGERIHSGYVSSMSVAVGQINKIRLICRNNQGWLYINDEFIAELDLSSRTNRGDIKVATGIYNSNEIDGEETRYTGFTVWSLP
jgi:eukaryotic-like serine/threonine-protein kinase